MQLDQYSAHAALLAAVTAQGEHMIDTTADFFTPKEWEQCARLGLTGLSVAKKYGGRGFSFTETSELIRAFGRQCPDMGLVFSVAAHLFACVMPLHEHGSPDLREQMLPGLATGRLVGANAITEDEAGSDVAAMATTAERVAGGYLLTGRKSFVSNAPAADVFLVYASTDPDHRHLGISAFVVDRHSQGLTVGAPMSKAGLQRCPASWVRFDRCFVPSDRLLGRPGQGMAIFQSSMRWERTCLFAAYLGQSERLLHRCVDHARHREQFGRPIGDNQAISHRLARMRLRTEAARLLLQQACHALDEGDRAISEVAMAKLAVSENAVQTALEALQLFGGSGILTDTRIEQALRDALPCTTFSGTSEMQLEQITAELGL